MKTNLAYSPLEELREKQIEAARGALPHIHIGLNTTVRATRERPERERHAIRWLANYIHREKITADAVCASLETDVSVVRAALTNPDADVRHLVAKIESLRSVLDSNLREPAQTEFFRDVMEAFDFAVEKGALVEFIDITRTGKTTMADWLHVTNLHRAVLVDCPHTESYASFVIAVARGCGISISSGKKGKKTHVLEAQIESMLGAGGFEILILDEGHYLWPTNIALKPKRIEFARKLWDKMKRKLAVLILSTPQAILSTNQAQQKAKRWSPGQWEGRISRFYPSSDVASKADIEKVARWHLPDGNAAIINQLVLFAAVSPGFYGAMVNVLERAQFIAKRRGEKLTVAHIQAAQAQAIRGTVLEKKLQEKGVRL